ncbi:MAG: hypothetical protein HXO29_10235 [Prevotella sp.]|jgi:hypothetical protein|nr:hypothetical protein [Prevotella sp.]MBF1611965.1 hypothetical protein [Prevotella sp.]
MKALVPVGTFAVCTNGMKMGKMIVTSQTTVKTSKGKLIATLKDKPTNFSCVWAGIIAAAVAAIVLALATTLGPLAVVIIATIVGMLGSFTLGSMLCYFCLKETPWLSGSEHPNVLISGNKALVHTAQITCTPLGFLPSGNIQLFFDKSVASRNATVFFFKNSLDILDGAALGAGLAGLGQIAAKVFTGFGGGLMGTTAAGIVTAGLIGSGYAIGKSIDIIQNSSSTGLANWITAGDYDKYESSKKKDNDEKIIDKVKKGTSNQPGDSKVIPPYTNQADINTKLNIGTLATGEVMKVSWGRVKADPAYHTGMPKSELNKLLGKYMKEVSTEVKLRNASLSKNMALKENVLKSLKDFFVVNGICIGVNIAGQTASKVIKTDVDKDMNKEISALSKIGIYEIKV